MSVCVHKFGVLPNGTEVSRVTLTNAEGTSVSVLDYGATLQSIIFAGKDILLGYDTVEGYVHANGSYMGATIGRFCNRIANGTFLLNGEEIRVACNESARHCHLHGGTVGFDKKMWDYRVLNEEEPSVVFTMLSPDGEENYPGNLQVSVTFILTADNTLRLEYAATTDKDTVVNLTNHSYFNLNGYDRDDILDTVLCVNADRITPVDEGLIPTGEYASVEGTALDFRTPKAIREGVFGDHPQIRIAGGVDHNYIINHYDGSMLLAAYAYSSKTGIRMDCYTNLPGLQIYTGNFIDEQSGKGGICWDAYDGFCLETQYFPDAMNHENFPSVFLAAGDTYTSRTDFHLRLV